jgi:hypothetical protein
VQVSFENSLGKDLTFGQRPPLIAEKDEKSNLTGFAKTGQWRDSNLFVTLIENARWNVTENVSTPPK